MPKRDDVVVKKGKNAPPLDPASVGSFSEQMQALYEQYEGTLQALGIQREMVGGEFRTTREMLRASEREQLKGAENVALERGVLGSTADLEARASVSVARQQAVSQARAAKLSTLAQLAQQALTAKTDYRLGLFNLLQAKKAQQAMAEAQEMFENLWGGGTTGTGPGGGGGGGGTGAEKQYGMSPQAQATLDRKTSRIKDLITSAAALHGVERSEIIERIKKVWQARNNLRIDYGLHPIPEDRMWELLHKAF